MWKQVEHIAYNLKQHQRTYSLQNEEIINNSTVTNTSEAETELFDIENIDYEAIIKIAIENHKLFNKFLIMKLKS